jgi:phytoene dehydrogenase-like protein
VSSYTSHANLSYCAPFPWGGKIAAKQMLTKELRYVGVGIHEEHDVRRIILCSRGTARDMMFGVEGHTWSIPEL